MLLWHTSANTVSLGGECILTVRGVVSGSRRAQARGPMGTAPATRCKQRLGLPPGLPPAPHSAPAHRAVLPCPQARTLSTQAVQDKRERPLLLLV